MKILILKVQAIGDTLLIVPLISNLYRYYGNPAIDVMVNEGTSQMLSLNPNISKIIEYKRESYRGLSNFQRLSKNTQLLKKIRKTKYDLVIDLDEGDRGAFITLISGAKTKLGSSRISSYLLRKAYTHLLPRRGNRHTVEINLDPLRLLDIPIIDKKVKIFWSPEDSNFVEKKITNIKKFIHFHPFSQGKYKDFNVKDAAHIIDFCEQELNIKVVITTGPIQRELMLIDDILELCKSNPVSMNGILTLKQVAALNLKSKLFIGVDTSVMHISAANNTPTLAIFGPSSPDSWGPWNNDIGEARYFRKGGVQINGNHGVISSLMRCVPCSNLGCDNSQTSDCMLELDLSSIKRNIIKMLNQ